MNKKNKNIILVIILILLTTSFFSGCMNIRKSFEYGGIERTYLIHIPKSYDETMPTPLVFVFHGGGGNAKNIKDTTNFSQKANEEGFIVVYPDGTGELKRELLTWNAGFCCGYARDNNIDDVGYIRALINHLSETYTIDPTMIYATGLSNGGVMTYRIGSELSDLFAAIAPVAAQIGGQATEEEKLWRIPEPENPVSVMIFNGMNDSRVPYDGGIAENTHVYSWMSTNESVSFWVEQNQCSSFPERNISETGNIIIDNYHGGKNNTEVTLISTVDGTHSWPGGNKGWENGAEPTKEISATDMMWDFFKTHPKTN